MNKKKFIRTDAHKKKKLAKNWRRPKGLHNKRRLRKKGYAPVVKAGGRTPNKTRNTFKGLKIVRIANKSQLESIDKKTEGIIISSGVGIKNKMALLEQAKKLGIKVLNLNLEKTLSRIKDDLLEKKKKKEALKSKKETKEKEKKKEEKKTVEEKVKSEETESKDSDEDEKADKQKKDFDKLLTKKQ
ncbi:MAG: eL32 family ribosomal protein [archaeon]